MDRRTQIVVLSAFAVVAVLFLTYELTKRSRLPSPAPQTAPTMSVS